MEIIKSNSILFIDFDGTLCHDKFWRSLDRDLLERIHCENMHISPLVLEKIQLIRDKFRTVLITDNMDSLTRFTVPSLKLNDYFDCISNSYDEGILKEEKSGEIFLQLCKKMKTKIERCMIIDDSQNTCKLFEKLGGQAFLVTSEKDLDYHLSLI